MRLSDYRKKHGLTQKQFGDRVGRSQPTVCSWENGSVFPDRESLMRIADETGGLVQPNDFFPTKPGPEGGNEERIAS